MKLEDYPTPLTDALYANLYHYSTPEDMIQHASGRERDHARDLERKLAMCRESMEREKQVLVLRGIYDIAANLRDAIHATK